MFSEITFEYQPFLYFLLAVPLLAGFYLMRNRYMHAEMQYSHSAFLQSVRKSSRLNLIHFPFILRMLVLSLLIVALARPQSTSRMQDVSIEGIDIVISLDISGSMLAADFQPNRMEAAKATALDFVRMRPGDRIGVTVFSGESFTLVPLTTDHLLLTDLLRTVHTGMVEDGTAIGDGLATAINRLRESDAISKVIILLTDGINNTGVIDPLTAAEIAQMQNIRVYTVGVGSHGAVPYPFQTPFGTQYRDVEIPVDEELLEEMARITGGRYFWADNQKALEEIYREIDQMERSKIDVMEFARKNDEYLPLVLLAMMLAGLEFILRKTWLRVTT
ncbi:MAG: VWA domain-containing protein [Bacteroidetes bacterium]|nr:MAG: VWA domain-containing protein [Bacteroidota bacterium]